MEQTLDRILGEKGVTGAELAEMKTHSAVALDVQVITDIQPWMDRVPYVYHSVRASGWLSTDIHGTQLGQNYDKTTKGG